MQAQSFLLMKLEAMTETTITPFIKNKPNDQVSNLNQFMISHSKYKLFNQSFRNQFNH